MPDPYVIFGAEISPYSVKVRSCMRYKRVEHAWRRRSEDPEKLYEKHAKLPLIPLVVTPDGAGLQDSTPILEALEAAHPEPSIHPDDPALTFISALLEEFGDEWGNKWMFHYRWWREADQISASERIAGALLAVGADEEQLSRAAASVRERMTRRLWFVGSSEQTCAAIEAGFGQVIGLLEAHLSERSYLFGSRPSFGDFGLWGQIYNAWTDPTPHGIIGDRHPHLVGWIERMLDPRAGGEWEPWDALEPTLLPLLKSQVGERFLPWSDANARALAAGREELEIDLPDGRWTQKVQKYHAKSLATLRARYAAVADRSNLDEILERAGCLGWLR